MTPGFWAGRRVFVTGHTGFKGAWLSEWLLLRGAQVAGFALAPDTEPALFDELDLAGRMHHTFGDIRDVTALDGALREANPDIVLHLAAQPLVRRSYREPVETFATNVMGTVHLLEALRNLPDDKPRAVVIVTTDKVYANNESGEAYEEEARLGGYDPYSASKAATELMADSFLKSYFRSTQTRIATARAGNVIGGGDWAEDRILPDCMRAAAAGEALELRNPHATRPWQHVLDPLHGYLVLAEALYHGNAPLSSAYNFGPLQEGQRCVADVLAEVQKHWSIDWQDASDPNALHETGQLNLSIERACAELLWQPVWGFEAAIEHTVKWYRDAHEGADIGELTRNQIAAFEQGASR